MPSWSLPSLLPTRGCAGPVTLIASLLLALGGLAPAAASAHPSACQLVPRSTVARVLGLPHVTTYSVSAPYQCGLAAWSKVKPTIPAHTLAAGKRLNAELHAGQIALLHVVLGSGGGPFQSLTIPPRTPFSLPLYGADGIEAGGEVGRNASDVGAGWWWWDDPSSPARRVRQTVELRLVQYHRNLGQLERELARVAAVAVPRAGS